MPNGKPHDNPVTDILWHDMHPLPAEMEQLIREIAAIDQKALGELGWEPLDWEKGENLKEGLLHLKRILERYGK
jgi:hypothetical protein